jgi:hypothetical protein
VRGPAGIEHDSGDVFAVGCEEARRVEAREGIDCVSLDRTGGPCRTNNEKRYGVLALLLEEDTRT